MLFSYTPDHVVRLRQCAKFNVRTSFSYQSSSGTLKFVYFMMQGSLMYEIFWSPCRRNRCVKSINSCHFYQRDCSSREHEQAQAKQDINHYSDVIFSATASRITGTSIGCSTNCSGADQRKHQSSAPKAFVRESTGDRWIPSQRASNAENVSIW